MGIHTNAEKVVKDFGFKPSEANSTHRHSGQPTEMRKKAEEAVAAMDEFLTTEGMVRIYALLKSARVTSSPRFDIGAGPTAIATEMEKRLKIPKEREAILKELGEIKKNLGDLEQRVKGNQGLLSS